MVVAQFSHETTIEKNGSGRGKFWENTGRVCQKYSHLKEAIIPMLIRVITLRFSAVMDGFDDTPLTEFIKDKSVISLREHLFIRNETPYLVVIVVYDPVQETALVNKAEGNNVSRNKRDESWHALLSDKDMPLFDTLRSWRSERCKKEGIPPYVICNNKQLAGIVKACPQSIAALMQIDGIGKVKVEKYGQEILAQLKGKNEKSTPDNKPK